jgi:hypothetical protein
MTTAVVGWAAWAVWISDPIHPGSLRSASSRPGATVDRASCPVDPGCKERNPATGGRGPSLARVRSVDPPEPEQSLHTRHGPMDGTGARQRCRAFSLPALADIEAAGPFMWSRVGTGSRSLDAAPSTAGRSPRRRPVARVPGDNRPLANRTRVGFSPLGLAPDRDLPKDRPWPRHWICSAPTCCRR